MLPLWYQEKNSRTTLFCCFVRAVYLDTLSLRHFCISIKKQRMDFEMPYQPNRQCIFQCIDSFRTLNKKRPHLFNSLPKRVTINTQFLPIIILLLLLLILGKKQSMSPEKTQNSNIHTHTSTNTLY